MHQRRNHKTGNEKTNINQWALIIYQENYILGGRSAKFARPRSRGIRLRRMTVPELAGEGFNNA
jgi:hypothetical protein